MASGTILLGVDLGTSSVKTLAVDENGHVLARGRQGYGLIRPEPGRVEQSPNDWWASVIQAIKQLATDIDLSQISAIGLSGQLNGLVFVDHFGKPIGNAPIWLDQRSHQESSYLSQHWKATIKQFALGEPAPIHNLSKILWFLKNRPTVIAKTYKMLFAKDYITLKLTGQYVTDISDASAALMLDLKKRQWATEFLDQVGIPLRLLPQLHESPNVVGSVSRNVALELGIREGTPVVAGAGDMAALAVGTGVITENSACATIGTAGHIALCTDYFPDKVDDRLLLMAHAVPGKYFWHGLVMTGGYCLAWFVDNFLQDFAEQNESDPYPLAFQEAAQASPGCDGLLFLPFLNGAATPFNDPAARAAFVGVTSTTTRAEFIRAILEGVAYNIRDSFELLALLGYKVTEVQVGEGGSRNPLWPRIISDVLGLRVNILSELDSSALGAAIIAGVGSGVWSFEEAEERVIRWKLQVEPDWDLNRSYTSLYQRYRKIYACLVPNWRDNDE